MKKLLIVGLCALVAACSTAPTPENVRMATGLVTSQYIQFGVKTPQQRVTMASTFQAITPIFASDTLFSPEQFQAELQKRLPANETKSLVVADATILYRAQYPTLQSLLPKDVPVYLQAIASGVNDGTAAFAH